MQDTLVLFNVKKGSFGLPINHVVSIEKISEISRIPNMPEYMLGIVNIRGQIIPVIDMSNLLFNQKNEIVETLAMFL
ncbi:chemotaxis protein CheW [Domibacillus epiphyticus]|uniref:CheW-like domain-containing protein n=1 Tax=Domibacillus epiphyticus TaxID=1714355 RepID=A0A1V2A627_9BACI|nr:chemotaxis protein CheW [Domibacillus epiphyticus]OMP66436.1 hypothetical protein BTO28_12085 [Domibacillus epiphyticus]